MRKRGTEEEVGAGDSAVATRLLHVTSTPKTLTVAKILVVSFKYIFHLLHVTDCAE